MKKTIFVFLVILLLANKVYAQEPDAGVTPDSPLWGLDKSLEQIELLLASGEVEKAKIHLKHANERLLEVKIMIEQNKLDDAEKAKEDHKEKIEKAKQEIDDIDADDEDSIEDEVELEIEIDEQENSIEEVEREIEIKIKGSLTAEQQAAIDALIESFKDSNNEVRIKIEAKKEEIKIKIRERTGMDDDEIEEEFEEHQNKTITMERAEEQIEDAEEQINEAKQDAREELGELTGNWSADINSLLREAEIKLANAKTAFSEGKYGEAYGQANAAEKLAKSIERKLDDLDDDEDDDDVERKYVSRDVEQCKLVLFQCAINEGYRAFSDATGCGCERNEDDDDDDKDDEAEIEDDDDDRDDDSSIPERLEGWDESRTYVRKNVQECTELDFSCGLGQEKFYDEIGCGCLQKEGYEAEKSCWTNEEGKLVCG